MFNRQQLIDLVQQRALQFGEFTLASGQQSHYYLDGKQITLHAAGLRLLSEGLLELLDDVEAVGGMSLGADPIIGGLLTVAAEKDRTLDGFLVRKEPKGHGTGRYIEGPVRPGARVAVVEDVITTAGSALMAVDRIEEFGCQVVQVVGMIDRLGGGAEACLAREIPLQTLLTIDDLNITS